MLSKENLKLYRNRTNKADRRAECGGKQGRVRGLLFYDKRPVFNRGANDECHKAASSSHLNSHGNRGNGGAIRRQRRQDDRHLPEADNQRKMSSERKRQNIVKGTGSEMKHHDRFNRKEEDIRIRSTKYIDFCFR